VGYPVRWVPNPRVKHDYIKQYFKGGRWHDKKAHKIKWNRVPYFIMGIEDLAYPRDAAPIRATLKLAARRLAELGDDYFYNLTIKELLQEDEDIRAIWKKVTLRIVDWAIRQIPAPKEVEGFKETLYELFNFLAEQFYDAIFSIEFQ